MTVEAEGAFEAILNVAIGAEKFFLGFKVLNNRLAAPASEESGEVRQISSSCVSKYHFCFAGYFFPITVFRCSRDQSDGSFSERYW